MDSDNFVTLTGRISTEPILKFVGQAGVAVCTFRLAQTQRRLEGTDWVDGETWFYDVECWRTQAERLAQLAKGTPVRATGKLVVSSWKTPDGENRYRTLISASGIEVMTILVGDIEATTTSVSLRWGASKGRPHNNDIESQVYPADERPF